jgi:hypothetical protein
MLSPYLLLLRYCFHGIGPVLISGIYVLRLSCSKVLMPLDPGASACAFRFHQCSHMICLHLLPWWDGAGSESPACGYTVMAAAYPPERSGFVTSTQHDAITTRVLPSHQNSWLKLEREFVHCEAFFVEALEYRLLFHDSLRLVFVLVWREYYRTGNRKQSPSG